MFRKMFKHRETSGGKASVKEEDSMEKESPDEDVLAEPVQAESVPSGEPEVVPTTEERNQGMALESAEGEGEGEGEGEQEDKGESSSFANLFVQTAQKEESSLDSLIDRLPDTTAKELLGDLKKVKALMRSRLS